MAFAWWEYKYQTLHRETSLLVIDSRYKNMRNREHYTEHARQMLQRNEKAIINASIKTCGNDLCQSHLRLSFYLKAGIFLYKYAICRKSIIVFCCAQVCPINNVYISRWPLARRQRMRERKEGLVHCFLMVWKYRMKIEEMKTGK